MRSISISVLILVSLVFISSCGENSDNRAMADCKKYCDLLLACDESEIITSEAVENCKQACDLTADGNYQYTYNDPCLECVNDTECEAFMSCVAEKCG